MDGYLHTSSMLQANGQKLLVKGILWTCVGQRLSYLFCLASIQICHQKCYLLHLYQWWIPPPTKGHGNISQEHFVPSFEIQSCWSLFQTNKKLWRDLVAFPANKPHLYHLRNDLGENIRVSRLIIAYSRHLNIGNLLSYRKICNRPGLKVPSFVD